MTPHWRDDWLTVYQGDCREVMRAMEPESVHTVVTSPPYWGLRDYGTAIWEGGDEGCDHAPSRQPRTERAPGGPTGSKSYVAAQEPAYRETCGKCGARRQDAQLGLEATPEEYVANMVDVFREVRRVLRSDGTVWLNLGDSYAGSWGANGRGEGTNAPRPDLMAKHGTDAPNRNVAGLKPKDLVGIPWRVAFALQADGWYLRSDIIWSKPNPMPESVTDRPTKSHEYLFLLSKSPRYFYDADAVREASTYPDDDRKARSSAAQKRMPTDMVAGVRPGSATYPQRNLRSVWTIATQPYPGAHFATFPRKLVEPCIKAGTSERGVCPECGAPWVRVVERSGSTWAERVEKGAPIRYGVDGVKGTPGGGPRQNLGSVDVHTTGWRPSCDHDLPAAPATVLDPFAGSGTTALVAQALGRRAVLIDLSTDYLEQIMARNAQIPLGVA